MIRLKNLLESITHNADSSQSVLKAFSICVLDKLPPVVESEVRAQFRESTRRRRVHPSAWTSLYSYDIKFSDTIMHWLRPKTIWSMGNYFVIRFTTKYVNEIQYYLIDGTGQYLKDAIIGAMKTRKTDEIYSSIQLKNYYNLSGEEIRWSVTPGVDHDAMLYDAVLEYAGVLFSDATLFRGSFNEWAHHVSKKAFFGGTLNTSQYDKGFNFIIPININTVNVDSLGALNNFVVVDDRYILPKNVRQLEYNTKNINPMKDLLLVNIGETFVFKRKYVIDGVKIESGYTIEDYLNNFSSIQEWVNSLGDSTDISKLITIRPMDTYSSVKLALVRCEDVVLILKNSSNGISVQILG